MDASPLVKKLQIKSGYRLAVIDPPVGYLARLDPLPEGAVLGRGEGEELDFVQLFVNSVEELERRTPAALESLKFDGVFWISFPRKSSKVETDLSRDVVWDVLGKSGIRPVAAISIDEIWSGLRFRPLGVVGR